MLDFKKFIEILQNDIMLNNADVHEGSLQKTGLPNFIFGAAAGCSIRYEFHGLLAFPTNLFW